MVSFSIKYDRDNRINGFTCSGHAGYAEKGTDIVCAAVSALTQSAILALERLVVIDLKLKADSKTGFLDCSWVNIPQKTEQAELIIKMVALGLAEIQKQYPDHLQVNEVEV
jgi:uncharacterized protein YsxB (DUF464 family)